MPKKSLDEELKDYTAMFIALKDIVEDTSNDILMKRPEPDRWSIKELVCHIVDTEIVAMIRMKKIIAENKPQLLHFDQDAWAQKLNYMEWDLKETLLLFGLARNSMASVLRTLPAAAWRRTGVHETRGSITLRQLLDLTNKHSKDHLSQIIVAKMKLEK